MTKELLIGITEAGVMRTDADLDSVLARAEGSGHQRLADLLLDEIATREDLEVLDAEVEAEIARLAEGAGKSLRSVIYAGEPFAPRPLAELMRALPHAEFFNFFGPTETNVCLAHLFKGPPSAGEEGRSRHRERVELRTQAAYPLSVVRHECPRRDRPQARRRDERAVG